MARKPVPEGGKRDVLVSAALKLFMKNGYEKTSVRMILNDVNGEVGMFYHYFKSKSELFEAAVELYFSQYSERFGNIVIDTSLPLPEQIDQLFQLIETSCREYCTMNENNSLHWTVVIALRDKTLVALQPYIGIILQNAIIAGIIQQPDVPVDELASFILHGVAGIMRHYSPGEITPEFFSMKKQNTVKLIANILRIPAERVGGYN